jgi:hypothetical protein
LCLFLCAAPTTFMLPGPAAAQSVWELTPYRIEVLVAFAPVPELTPRLQAELVGNLVDRAESLVGAAWDVTFTLRQGDAAGGFADH